MEQFPEVLPRKPTCLPENQWGWKMYFHVFPIQIVFFRGHFLRFRIFVKGNTTRTPSFVGMGLP